MATVRLEEVTKAYGKIVAADHVSLDIRDGEFIILVGPSGCGKSTVLRMIVGLEEITSGQIRIDERVINDVHPNSRDIAMVFQNYALYPHMDVYDNMAFCLRQRKVSRDEIERIVRHTAGFLGIEPLLRRKPRELSGGQRQRVALGRAIVRCPKVFLFDEPLSNLDAKLRIAMRAELLDLHQKLKTTTIYVTHDQMEAMTMGDRIVVMNEGRIQQVDTPQNVYDHPVNRFVAGFIGAPSMNFIDCTLDHKDGRFFAVNDSLRLQIPEEKTGSVKDYAGRPVTLGVRPEHVSHLATSPEVDPNTSFKAAVWVVEPLGSEKLVYLRIAGATLVARISPKAAIKPGEEAGFAVDMDSAHLFDPQTQKTIL